MKLKIVLLLFILIFFSGCYVHTDYEDSVDLDIEKLVINDYKETIKNFENKIKVIDVSEPQCGSGHSGGACYINLILQGYEKQNFTAVEYKYFLGQTTAIRLNSSELVENYIINKSYELENSNCICEISSLSLFCECENVFYNSTFSYDYYTYVSYPNYEAVIDELKYNCINVEFVNQDGTAYLDVDVRNFNWFNTIPCPE